MWLITRPGAVQKPDAVTVCNKGESCAKMTPSRLAQERRARVSPCPSRAWVFGAVEGMLSGRGFRGWWGQKIAPAFTR